MSNLSNKELLDRIKATVAGTFLVSLVGVASITVYNTYFDGNSHVLNVVRVALVFIMFLTTFLMSFGGEV